MLAKQRHKLNQKKKLLSWSALLVVLASYSLIQTSFAGDYKLGLNLGYGGVGLQKTQPEVISRAETPGVISLSLDYLLSDYWILSVDHTRGFKFSPFSSGAQLTGITGRWFFRDAAPSVSKKTSTESTFLIKRFSPFAGFSLGLGSADITRELDQNPEVKVSSTYIGYRFGVEYPLKPGAVFRFEFGMFHSLGGLGDLLPIASPDGITGLGIQIGYYIFI